MADRDLNAARKVLRDAVAAARAPDGVSDVIKRHSRAAADRREIEADDRAWESELTAGAQKWQAEEEGAALAARRLDADEVVAILPEDATPEGITAWTQAISQRAGVNLDWSYLGGRPSVFVVDGITGVDEARLSQVIEDQRGVNPTVRNYIAEWEQRGGRPTKQEQLDVIKASGEAYEANRAASEAERIRNPDPGAAIREHGDVVMSIFGDKQAVGTWADQLQETSGVPVAVGSLGKNCTVYATIDTPEARAALSKAMQTAGVPEGSKVLRNFVDPPAQDSDRRLGH